MRQTDLSAMIRRGVARGSVRITGLDGRLYWSARSQDNAVVQLPKLKQGVVVVTVRDGDKITVQRVLVR